MKIFIKTLETDIFVRVDALMSSVEVAIAVSL